MADAIARQTKELTMLRITTHENAALLTFQLEGRLVGPWVGTLRDCWQHFLTRASGRTTQIDLRGVTFVDAAGKALLSEMAGQNAQLIACDCLMKALVAEIEHAREETC
jgi:ABC-type transporter Mla MlaB component